LNPESRSQTDLPGEGEVHERIRSLALGVDPSELHGLLAGYLCGGGQASRDSWLATVLLDPDAPRQGEGSGVLDQLYRCTSDQLADPGFGFELLLPGEGEALDRRTGALLGWCRGFLGGFGLAAGAKPPLSEESAEALEDMARIAASSPGFEDPETDEAALAEITEFVRVAALLLHGDCVMGRAARQRLH